MIYVITPNRSKANAYLMVQRRRDPANHVIVTSVEESARCRKPTEHDEIVFLGADLNAAAFFQSWMSGKS